MADINALASQFVNFYYETFDSNRSNLQGLYVSLKEYNTYTRIYHIDTHLFI